MGVEQGTSTPGGGQCIFELLQEGGVAEMRLTCVQSGSNEPKLSASMNEDLFMAFTIKGTKSVQ